MKKHIYLLVTTLLAGICLLSVLPAQDTETETEQRPVLQSLIRAETLPSPPKPKGRPSVALVLSGGGARGFAHIPVLELLEEEHIPIDMIVGNSAGAIAGALYAVGYSATEIRDKLAVFSHEAILSDGPYSPFEKILTGHSTFEMPIRMLFGSRNNTFTMGTGTGVLSGQNVYEIFKELTIKIPSDIDFNNLAIPFRAVSTNLLEGKVEVLDHGDIAEAMRASMSIPGLFVPFEHEGKYLIDGLALDNEPIDVAVKMGYDIIIVSTCADDLQRDYNKFDTNFMVAVLQMINMDQADRNANNRKLAQLVIFPDFANENLIAYAHIEKIYNASKKSMEQYRSACGAIYKKIYPDSPDAAHDDQCLHTNYSDLPYLTLDNLSISGALPSDINFITLLFNGLKGKKITEDKITELADDIDHTGKYQRVLTRINTVDGKNTLEIILLPEKKENGLILAGGSFEGNIADDSSTVLSLATDIQWRGLTGYGSVLSLKGSVLNGISGSFLFQQPIGSHLFIQFSVDYSEHKYYTETGWRVYPSELLTMSSSAATLKFAVPFHRSRQIISADVSLRGFGTEDDFSNGFDTAAVDFSEEYILNTLDNSFIPFKGMYFSAKTTGVVPLQQSETAHIFDVETVDFTGVVPINKNTSFSIGGFTGTNISQRMENVSGAKQIYGFTLRDRRFFPQISSPNPWGIHKTAFTASLHYNPHTDFSTFGMEVIFSVSGAVGNVWQHYDEISFANLQWDASANIAFRIQRSFGILLRAGAGTSRNNVLPFVAFDIGNIRF